MPSQTSVSRTIAAVASLAIAGGGFSDPESNIWVDYTQSAVIRFYYENKENRVASGTNEQYFYPRLQKIENGYGGSLTYTYGNDERGANSLLAGLVAEIAHPDARRDLHGFTPLAADAVATGDADPIAAEAAFDASRLEPGQVFILVEPGRAAFALHLAGYSAMSGPAVRRTAKSSMSMPVSQPRAR